MWGGGGRQVDCIFQDISLRAEAGASQSLPLLSSSHLLHPPLVLESSEDYELVSWLSAGVCGWRGGQESSGGQRGLLPGFRTPLVRGALGSVPNSRHLALFSPCGRDDDELLRSHP